MIPVYAKEITATQFGQKLEQVVCEKCKTEFFYELTRVGVGKGSALYGFGQGKATRRAYSDAAHDLDQRLHREAELVPCPKCHWVNQDLVDRYRKRKYHRAPLVIGIIIAVCFVAAPIVWASLDEWYGYNKSHVPTTAFSVIVAVAFLSPVYVLLIQRQLRRRINPNLTYPRPPSVPLGTPVAMLLRNDPQTGAEIFVPVASGDQLEQAKQTAKWAVFRPAQVAFPPLCCTCLAEASTRYRSPLRVNERSEFAVPLCGACSSRLKRRWWLTIIIVTIFSLGAAAIAALTVPSGDAFGRWFGFGILGSFVALIGGVVTAGIVCRPYRIKVVDTDRGLIRFAASNPGYTAMLAEQARLIEGLPAKL